MCKLIAKIRKASVWKVKTQKSSFVEVIECVDCGSWFQVTKKCNEKQLFKYCPNCGKPKQYPEV